MKYIKEITAIDTFLVRHPVLRPGKNRETCHFEGDALETTKHFGYFVDTTLAGVASLFQSKTDLISNENQFQLRGMAVLESFQKQGIGDALLDFAENNAKERNGEVLWFNAREIAIPFYEKSGYKIIGNPFEIGDIGIHFVMFKEII